jgi:hypothetical protein
VFPEGFVAIASADVGTGPAQTSFGRTAVNDKESSMLYALLAYHVEADVMSWSAEKDAALMHDLHKAHRELADKLGPAVRLGPTDKARTLRGPGAGQALDGPFAETKEQLLGLYILNVASEDEALDAARRLRRVNPHAVYEIRPIRVYLPGTAIPGAET